jgi:hypothetical protein
MAAVSAVQAAIGGVTLYFLLLTFRETRKTTKAVIKNNRQTRELFIAEQRPWIQIVSVELADLRVEGGFVKFRPKVILESSGKSPAENVRQHWEILPDASTARAELQRIAAEEFSRKAKENDTPGELLFPERKLQTEPKLSISKPDLGDRIEIAPVLIGCITYQTSLAGERFQTVYFSRIERTVQGDPKREFLVNRDGTTHRANLRFKGTFIRDSGIAGAAPVADEDDRDE